MIESVRCVDAYLAVRDKDGEIWSNPSSFSDPDMTPVVVARFRVPENAKDITTAVYHSDLQKVETFPDQNLYSQGSPTWSATLDTIRAFSDKLDRGPRPGPFTPRWSREAEQDLQSVHNVDAAKTLSELMAKELVREIDKELLESAGVDLPEVDLEIESTVVVPVHRNRLTSSVRV